jgi:hypothetical protein
VKTARYVRDYAVTTEDERDSCRELAEIVCTIKKMLKGTAEHQRLLVARGDLRKELEEARASRTAASMSSEGRVVFVLPAKDDREVRAAMEHEQREREARTPGASEPSREPGVGSDTPAVSEGDLLLDAHRVPQRIFSDGGRRCELVMRRVTEQEVERCLGASGDWRTTRPERSRARRRSHGRPRGLSRNGTSVNCETKPPKETSNAIGVQGPHERQFVLQL